MTEKMVEIGKPEHGLKRKRSELLKKYDIYSTKLEVAHAQINASDGMVFPFVNTRNNRNLLRLKI